MNDSRTNAGQTALSEADPSKSDPKADPSEAALSADHEDRPRHHHPDSGQPDGGATDQRPTADRGKAGETKPEGTKDDAAKADPPKADRPKIEAAKADPSKADLSKADRPKVEAAKADGAKADVGRGRPARRPPTLSLGTRLALLPRVLREANADGLPDWAAALTYYGVLSIFPGLLLLAAVLGLLGESATQPLLDNLSGLAPGPAQDLLTASIRDLTATPSAAGPLAIAGLAGALWSTSGYVAAFMRASNAIYDVPEGRPIWKTLPIRLVVTVVVGVMLAASALLVVFTGGLATRLGRALGVSDTAVTVWSIAKWPALLILVSLVFALLYWASPNAKQTGFRWITAGGVLAVLLWIAASLGFAFYVANFGSYDKTYGALGGVIVFLVWLWISNLAILLGAELNAELHRARAIAAGHPRDKEPYLALRDTRKLG